MVVEKEEEEKRRRRERASKSGGGGGSGGKDGSEHALVVREKVGRFLAELCRPLRRRDVGLPAEDEDNDGKDNNGEDNDEKGVGGEEVREQALAALTALLSSRLLVHPSGESGDDGGAAAGDEATAELVCRSIALRLDLVVAGVRRRCASSDDGDAADTSAAAGYEGLGGGERDVVPIEEGLSRLHRAKRSSCFDVLGAVLSGAGDDLGRLPASADVTAGVAAFSAKISATAFASFAASCLHGETDPRCLLQLLRLVNASQRVFAPLFVPAAALQLATSSSASSVPFPSSVLFDSVAPYYPVHFTPPKNNPHGITRPLLKEALMNVLCERGVTSSGAAATSEEGAGSAGNEEDDDDSAIDDSSSSSMAVLAGRLFLERMDPPRRNPYDDPYGEPAPLDDSPEDTVEDKQEALEDLSRLLMPSSSAEAMTATPQINNGVTATFLSELSASLSRTHEEAVTGASGNTDAAQNRELSEACRAFASSLSLRLERAGTASTRLWEAFVLDALKRLSPVLSTSPQGTRGRSATALLASFAACGGRRTLDATLGACLPALMSALPPDGGDEEKMTAVARGIAALFSSCRVSLERLEKEMGVKLHPHPLDPHASGAIERLSHRLCSNEGGSELEETDDAKTTAMRMEKDGSMVVLGETASDEGEGTALRVAATGALESVVTAMASNALTVEDAILLEGAFSSMAKVVLSNGPCRSSAENGNERDRAFAEEWEKTCARTLGTVIGHFLRDDDAEGEGGSPADGSGRFRAFLGSLLSQILSSSTSPSNHRPRSQGGGRKDWAVLDGACAQRQTKGFGSNFRVARG